MTWSHHTGVRGVNRVTVRELDAGQHPAVQADRALNLGLPL